MAEKEGKKFIRPENLLESITGIDFKGLGEEERAMKQLLAEEYKKQGTSLVTEVKNYRKTHPRATLEDSIRTLYQTLAGKDAEGPQSRIEDPEFMQNFIETYTRELEEMVTRPKGGFTDDERNIVEAFKNSQKKIPAAHDMFRNLLVRVGQDFRLTPDEIDIVENRFLEKKF